MLAGNLVVFPKFFNTYYPKVTRFSTDAARSLKSRLTRRHPESSASRFDQPSTSNMLQDYTKLNDDTHAPTTFPSNNGRGPHPVMSTTSSAYNSEPDSMRSDDGNNRHNGILKTVRVGQGVQYG